MWLNNDLVEVTSVKDCISLPDEFTFRILGFFAAVIISNAFKYKIVDFILLNNGSKKCDLFDQFDQLFSVSHIVLM